MCESYVRATERAALAGARWLGRADQESAEESAFSGMEAALAQLPITGSVVIGAGDVEAGSALSGTVGAGGEHVDLALDPLEGRGVVARGGNGAISMIVVGEPGKLRHLPDMYMRTIAVGPLARGRISLLRPVGENVRSDRRGLRAQRRRHHDDRPRPASPPRPDRGDPGGRRPDQADPGRHRHRGDLGGDPRHERPPRDRDRRHAAGGADRGRAPLPRRRDPGAALADLAARDRGGAASTGSRTSSRCSRPRTSSPAR